MSYERHGSFRRTYLAILGGATVIAVVGTVFAGLLSSESVAAPTATPVNTSRPTITGSAIVGQTLAAGTGSWSGSTPITFAFVWKSCDSSGANCSGSATGRTWLVKSSDVGSTLRVQVTATNAEGSASALSAATAVVKSASPSMPRNTVEPKITGTARVGSVQTANRGSWAGASPISYAYAWFRCEGAGAPDASNCPRITNASNATYVAREADAGFRLRVRVTATNSQGSAVATSNPTQVILSDRPTNTTEPTISGTPVVGNQLTANRGAWAGDQPITYAFRWLRCSTKGDNCSEIAGATDIRYGVVADDVGRTIRVRVTANNAKGSSSALANPTGVVGSNQPPPPSSGGIPVADLKAAGDRLVVASVQFSPNPVRSRTAAITVRVRITARGGRPVSGALVFMRATPRVVSGQTQATQADGYVTLTLVPNQAFPQPRNGFNVQFFIKASKPGDPGLGGVAGYRLVQVRLAG